MAWVSGPPVRGGGDPQLGGHATITPRSNPATDVQVLALHRHRNIPPRAARRHHRNRRGQGSTAGHPQRIRIVINCSTLVIRRPLIEEYPAQSARRASGSLQPCSPHHLSPVVMVAIEATSYNNPAFGTSPPLTVNFRLQHFPSHRRPIVWVLRKAIMMVPALSSGGPPIPSIAAPTSSPWSRRRYC